MRLERIPCSDITLFIIVFYRTVNISWNIPHIQSECGNVGNNRKYYDEYFQSHKLLL